MVVLVYCNSGWMKRGRMGTLILANTVPVQPVPSALMASVIPSPVVGITSLEEMIPTRPPILKRLRLLCAPTASVENSTARPEMINFFIIRGVIVN
jgi:hypothetical protein